MDLAHPASAARPATRAELPVAGVVLFALAAQFMTVLMLAASIAPGYDVRGGAISDLGVIAETRILFNASLFVVGVLNVAGGLLLFRVWGTPWIAVLFTVAGLGAAGAGIFPLDTGAPHSLSAVVAFVAFNLQALAAGRLVAGPMRWISTLAGALGLSFLVLMVLGDAGSTAAFGPIGHGGTERMIVFPPMLWMLAFGGYLMARGER